MNERVDYLTVKCKQALEKENYDDLLSAASELEKIVEERYLARFWQEEILQFTQQGA